jgi:hypothetical protein
MPSNLVLLFSPFPKNISISKRVYSTVRYMEKHIIICSLILISFFALFSDLIVLTPVLGQTAAANQSIDNQTIPDLLFSPPSNYTFQAGNQSTMARIERPEPYYVYIINRADDYDVITVLYRYGQDNIEDESKFDVRLNEFSSFILDICSIDLRYQVLFFIDGRLVLRIPSQGFITPRTFDDGDLCADAILLSS